MYQAHEEGIKDEVFIESKKLRSEDTTWRYKEYSDLIGEAYRIVKERKNKEDENRH